MSSETRILIVGAGAVGGYIGARLADAGRSVSFLVRGKRAEQLATDGLKIRSPHGDLTIKPEIVTAEALHDPFDLVILSVKGPALAAALDDLAPAVGPDTTILPLLNGMRHMEVIERHFPGNTLVGGVALLSTMVEEDGTVTQLTPLQKLSYGETDRSSSARIRKVDTALRDAGLETVLEDNIVQAMWDKWFFLASTGAVTTLMEGNIGDVVAAGGAEAAAALVEECRAVIEAAGHEPAAPFVIKVTSDLTQAGSSFNSSLFRDLTAGNPLENEAIIGDLVRIADQHALSVPLLRATAAKLVRREQVRQQRSSSEPRSS